VLGVTGSMLAATGIFGMAAYSVSKQLREQGIRMPVPGELNRGKLSMQCNMTLLHSGRFARTGSRFLSSWMSLISKAFAPDGIFGTDTSRPPDCKEPNRLSGI
jgi:hypothetical protein